MQEKTLQNPKVRTSNIHSSEVGSVSYDIFGSPYQKSGSFLADDSLDFGYLGKPYNADTELYDYGFRDYSLVTARFSTVDPIRDGRNWYCYVVNDPVNYVDLWGLCGSDGNSKYNPEDSVWYNYTGIGCPYPEKETIEEKQLISTELIIRRETSGYGNKYNSQRIIVKNYSDDSNMFFIDECGANCKDIFQAIKYDGMTLPDGEYYLTTDYLIKNSDKKYDSGSYEYVLRLQTKDTNISQEIRDEINSGYYLLHANQKKIVILRLNMDHRVLAVQQLMEDKKNMMSL